MTQAHTAVSCWLGQSGQCNSRIEALYQAVEDQDMTTIRAMLEGAWRAGYAAGEDARLNAICDERMADGTKGIPVHLSSQRALTGDGIGGRDE